MRMNRLPLFVLFSIFLLSLCHTTQGAIFSYSQYKLKTNSIQRGVSKRVGMFSPGDAPSKTSPGNGQSYFDFNFHIEVKEDKSMTHPTGPGFLNFALLSSQDQINGDSEDFCCTNTTRNCTIGHLTLEHQASSRVETLSVDPTDLPKNFSMRVDINKTDIMYVNMIYCGPKNDFVFLNGELTFMNPFGHLDGQEWYFLPFYSVMTVLYAIVTGVWLYYCYQFRQNLVRVHNWITAIMILCTLDSGILAFSYLGFNNEGTDYLSAFISAALANPFKATFSRLVILIVSMGYTVVRKTITASRSKLILWAFLFYTFTLTSQLYKLINRGAATSWEYPFFVLLPLAFLDTTFFFWAFISIYKTVNWLKTKPSQKEKYELYRVLFRLMMYVMVLAGFLLMVKGYIDLFWSRDETWKGSWFFSASSSIFFFFVFLKIAHVWWPNRSTNFAYTELDIMEIDDTPDDVPLPTVTSFFEKEQPNTEFLRQISPSFHSDSEEESNKND